MSGDPNQDTEKSTNVMRISKEQLRKLQNDLWYMLMEKTDGEARAKVKTISNECGITGYTKMYQWYSALTGLNVTQKTKAVMSPERPKRPADVAAAIDIWKERVDQLERYGTEYKLSVNYKLTALKEIMHHREDWFEEKWEETDDDTGNKFLDTRFAELLIMCEAWARRKKVEQDTGKMASIDEVNQSRNDPWWSSSWDPWETQPDKEMEWGDSEDHSIDAVGKGKGKSKGIKGSCWICGKPGHRAADCYKGKGKGPKGKGKGSGYPKGYGKGWNKGYQPKGGWWSKNTWGYQKGAGKNQSANGVDEEPTKDEPDKEDEEISFGNPHPLVAEVTMAPPDRTSDTKAEKEAAKTKEWTPKLMKASCNERCGCGIHMLEQEHKRINAVPKQGDENMEVVTGNIDSAACHTVGPRTMATAFPVERTEAVANNRNYMAANGTKIMNYGQRIIKGTTADGTKINMPMQVTDVDKLLIAACELVESGNKVVLDLDKNGKSMSYIEHKPSGRKTKVEYKDGSFQMDIRIPKPRTAGSAYHVQTENRYSALADDDDDESDFEWLGLRSQ